MLRRCNVLIAIVSLGIAGTAHADVLYDTLGDLSTISDPPTYVYGPCCATPVFSFIGGGILFGGDVADMQAAEDFTLTTAHTITSATVDFTNGFETGTLPVPNGGSVMVEFFADVNGVPSEVPTAAVASASWTLFETIPNVGLWGPAGNGDGARLALDLSGENIVLGPGTWWLSVLIVDESPTSDYYGWLAHESQGAGGNPHVRDGGVDHGNGYFGFYETNDWDDTVSPGEPVVNLAMKIEGTPDETGCSADITDSGGGAPDGTVNVFDLLELLANWGTNGNGAAIADPTNIVDVFDLLDLLAAWGSC